MMKTELQRFFGRVAAIFLIATLVPAAAVEGAGAATPSKSTTTKTAAKSTTAKSTTAKSTTAKSTTAKSTTVKPTTKSTAKSKSTRSKTTRAKTSRRSTKARAAAAPGHDPLTFTENESGPASVTGDFVSAIVVDVNSGLIIEAHRERERRPPASMLKMMTELLVLEAADRGELSLADTVTVTKNASNVGGSQVYLKAGEKFTVRELLMALCIHSANDAAAALAEHVAGSTAVFVERMNVRARELHMNDTEFHSVHGLPPARGQKSDMSTAYDMTLLGREVIKHPEALEWGSTATAPFRGGTFTLHNPNRLIGKFEGLDGLKTGYTRPAGFCVTATAVRNGQRLLSCVMGCSTNNARASETNRLLTHGFNMYEPVKVIDGPGAALPVMVTVKDGKVSQVPVTYGEALTVSVPKGRRGDLVIANDITRQAQAPLAAGAEVGRAMVKLGDRLLGTVPIVTMQEAPRGSWFHRLVH
jgi:D-alanyl-D-alanine carboxypeptidase (penicillin-binding protein 5/6)